MAEPARKRMTVAAFLQAEGLEEGRYELIDGEPVMMAPTLNAHGGLAFNLGAGIAAALRKRPGCRGYQQAGVRSLRRRDTFYISDLVVSCRDAPHVEREIQAPLLIVEILSPSTEAIDRRYKLLDYRDIVSVQEILFVDAREVFCEVHRRGDQGWQVDVLGDIGDSLRLSSIGLAMPLRELYVGFATGGRRGLARPRRQR